ncbi:MAG: M15 family metallopeptidase [Pseudolabrys sp.]
MIRCALAALLVLGFAQSCLGDPLLDALVGAYPDFIAGYDAKYLNFKDGTRLPVSDGKRTKSFEQLLESPDIKDQFAIPYPLGIAFKKPQQNEDPGRIRNEPFFRKMYGDCRKGDVARHLKAVAWLPHRGGGTVMATTINGFDGRLAAVSRELETLPVETTKYLVPSSGTYNCRAIAGTDRLSMHAYAAAIDINAKFGDYWRWPKNGKDGNWQSRIPAAIVEIFERNGFIWGGKWYHYDTLHFEYRPEIIAYSKLLGRSRANDQSKP